MEPLFRKTVEIPESVDSLILISDIHGVLESLAEVDGLKQELEEDGPVQVIVLGDMLPGGVNPLETLDWVREHAGEFALLGNHDVKMLNSPNEPAHLCTEQGVRHILDDDGFGYMHSLPLILDLTWGSHRILCAHGHLSFDGTPLTNQELPHELFDKLSQHGAALAVTGHTHYPFVLERDGQIVANTGSPSRLMFGVSSKGGPVRCLETGEEYSGGKEVYSSCLVVREESGTLDVQIREFDYDRDDYVRKLKEAGDPWFDINKIIFETGVAYW